jgi:hypothetical protein
MDVGQPKRVHLVEPIEAPVPEKPDEEADEPARPEPSTTEPEQVPA